MTGPGSQFQLPANSDLGLLVYWVMAYVTGLFGSLPAWEIRIVVPGLGSSPGPVPPFWEFGIESVDVRALYLSCFASLTTSNN